MNRYLVECPVKLGKLAKELNVSVKISSLPTGVTGQIRREGDGYVIRVNRYEARACQRFTIAHEISHYLLHQSFIDSIADGIVDNVLYESDAPERFEIAANRLAMKIVAPMTLIEEKLAELGGVATEATTECLADMFQVPKPVMEIRLTTLAEV